MINYIEKGYGLHKLIKESGHSLKQVDDVWISSNNSVVQAIIDDYNPLPEAKTKALTALGKHASDLIDKNIDPIKAKRIQSDALFVTSKGSRGAALNAGETAKLTALEDAMIYPNAIFAQYDIEAAKVTNETDWTNIQSIVDAATISLEAI